MALPDEVEIGGVHLRGDGHAHVDLHASMDELMHKPPGALSMNEWEDRLRLMEMANDSLAEVGGERACATRERQTSHEPAHTSIATLEPVPPCTRSVVRTGVD